MRIDTKLPLLCFGTAVTWATIGVIALSMRGTLPWVTFPLSLFFIGLVSAFLASALKLFLMSSLGTKLLASRYGAGLLGLTKRRMLVILGMTALLRLLLLVVGGR